MLLENNKSDDISVGIGAEYMSIRCEYLQEHRCLETGSGSDAVLGKNPLNLADNTFRLAMKSDIFD